MGVKLLHQTDTAVVGQESDAFRALAILMTLASLAPGYAMEPLFTVHERFKNAVDSGSYAIAYERKDAKSPLLVPVGLITWGLLSNSAGMIVANGLRPLYPTELKSGRRLWVLDKLAQYGHGDLLDAFVAAHFPDHAEYAKLVDASVKLFPNKAR